METKKVDTEVKHMKRWEFYTIIALIVAVIGFAGWATYTYVWGPEEQEVDITPAQTSEEKALTEVKGDLDQLEDLDLSDVDTEINELESIDLSGV